MKLVAIAISIVGGLAGSVQVAIMGRFGSRIGVVPALAFAALVAAALSVGALLVSRRSLAGLAEGTRVPTWMWTGGALSVIVVFGITLAAPRIGVLATVGIFLAAQLGMGLVIDRYGLFGGDRFPLHWPRVAGIVLLAIGAALALRK